MSTATSEYTTVSDVEFQIKRVVDAPRELVYDASPSPST